MRPGGLLEPIPEWKLEDISIDFITVMPRAARGYDMVWVIVDRLMISVHLISIRLTYTVEKLEEI